MAVESGPGSRADTRPAAMAAEEKRRQDVPAPVLPTVTREKGRLPRWKFIVTLGLVSAMGIGLVILQQAAQEELGTQDLKAQEESEGFNEVEPMGGEIEVTQRFIDLLNGRVSAMDWFASGPHWLTRRPQMTLADFGMTPSEMPRETDAQERLISLRHQATRPVSLTPS